MRKATKDFTFSDGTFIPKGTRINAGLAALHYDDALYENPEEFVPFRFVGMGKEDKEGVKNQFVATSPQYLSFGHGRYAWYVRPSWTLLMLVLIFFFISPGRFFAAAVLKTMLAHVVTMYDIKLEENVTRPRSLRIGNSISANPTAKVMFRKRARHGGAQ